MIKINLLPTKKKPPKKVMDLQKQALLAVLVLILIGIVLWYVVNKQKNQIAALEKEKVSSEAKLREQDNTLKEVKNVEEERRKVSEKIDVIERLKKNQSGPVRLLDEISKALPLGVNLSSLTESNNNINLDGEAFTNEDVVRFVDNLKASRLLTNVMLLETSQIRHEGLDMYKYKIQFTYKGL
ncbi:MAG TPA: PilN domain-containing protein [Nitrospirota bacterium]|nr:PilN domain-containing protein [Nitrospirota bacterium]